MSSLKDRTRAGEGAPVVAVWREPYSLGQPTVEMWRQGMTVFEIVKAMPCLPVDFEDRGVVQINGHEVNRGAWHLVRPKGSTNTMPISVTFHMPLRGGKGSGGGGKQVIGIVALLALTLLTAGISSGLLLAGASASLGSALGVSGVVGAKLLAGTVGIIGALAISALTRPPTAKPKEDVRDETEAASAEGNTIEPNGAIPRVIGTRKVFPPMACEPLVELIGSDEYVEALFILNGPHAISEIKIGDATINDDDSIEYQIRDGWPGDPLQTFATKISRTTATNVEMKGHKIQTGSDFLLADQTSPEKSTPKFQRFSARPNADRIDIHFLWPGNIIYSEDPTITISHPIRIRMREVGSSTWINLPELHMMGGLKPTQIRAQVVIHWDYSGDRAADKPGLGGGAWWLAHTQVPQQTATPADPTYQWEADGYFYSGSYARYASYATSAGGVQNMGYSADPSGASTGGAGNPYDKENGDGDLFNAVHIYLDSGTFPKGQYEFEVIRGSSYRNSLFTTSTYAYQGGVVRNFFRYYDAGSSSYRVPQTQRSINDNVIITRVVSVWNEIPLPSPGFATIAIRAKNKSVQQVSCTASGYVRDWDGSGWSTWTTTSNPAPHYRDILVGRHNIDPVPLDLIDDNALVAWRAHCASNSYTCDMIADGMRIDEVLNIVASCGYAQPYFSDIWSVIQDYDRSAESPVQVFTPRNSRGFQFRKAFPRMPDGLLISYRSDEDDYRQQQVAVYRDGVTVVDGRIEQTSYEGIVGVTKIEARGAFDLLQAEYRSTFYTLEASVDSIVCRRGSLVAVQHDIVTKHCGAARITSVEVSGGNITAIKMDAKITVLNEDAFEDLTEVSEVEALEDVGLTMGCAIRRTDGTITTHAISNAAGETDVITFTTPFANDTTTGGPFDPATINEVMAGCLIVIGPLAEEYIRLIVTEIMPGADLTARLTLVDEAPELWAA